MRTLGYYNGVYDELENMKIPMNDRACYFGDGVYDATYSRNYKIFTLQEHIDRFFRSAELTGIAVPVSKKELQTLLETSVKKLDTGNLFVYWQVTRGTGIRDHVYSAEEPGNLWLMIKPAELKDLQKRIKLVTVEDTRFLHCNVKTLNLLPNVIAAQYAKEKGGDEAVFHRGARVTECAHSNIHILREGVLYTHPADCYILEGVARGRLLSACKAMGIDVREVPFSIEEMKQADEVIVTSAGSLCLAASEIDGVSVGGKGSILLQKLQNYLLSEFVQATE